MEIIEQNIDLLADKQHQASEEYKAAEEQRLLAFYDSLSDEEKKEMDRKTEERLNNFEKKRLRKYRHAGGEIPPMLTMSLEIAKFKVLREKIFEGLIKHPPPFPPETTHLR